MLTTRLNFTGSAPIANTMGMLEVAALAASAAAVAPPVAITATRRATNSAASAGRRDQLLGPAVQKTDMGVDALDDLTVELQYEADAVHRSGQPHIREDHGDLLSADQ
jgi:hypothetical protein